MRILLVEDSARLRELLRELITVGRNLVSGAMDTSEAVAPELGAGVLNVGGAGLTAVVRESATFAILVQGLQPDGLTRGDMVRFFAMGQGVLDAGDSLNFAPYVNGTAGPDVPGWRQRHLLLQEVPGDRTVPNNLGGALTVGYSQLPTIAGKASEHGALLLSTEASTQYAHFLDGALLGAGPATVIDPYAAK